MDNKGKSPGKFGDIDFKNLNIGQIVELCLKCETKEDAHELLRQYEKYFDDPTIARNNLGYMFGYYDPEDRKKLYALFPVNHPMFGSEFGRGRDPSPEEAFKTGEKMGDEIKEGMKKNKKDI
jgi:hypothetical protein